MSEPTTTDARCPHGRPWADCYDEDCQGVLPSGDGSGTPGPLGHPNIAFCTCESAWFKIDGAVSLNLDGAVIAYSGELVCIECDDRKPLGFTGDHPWQWRKEDQDGA